RARARIEALAENAATASPQDRRKRQVKLSETLESYARSHDWEKMADELATAEAAWEKWSEGAEQTTRERFETARNLVQSRVAAHDKEIADAEAKKLAFERAVSERTR